MPDYDVVIVGAGPVGAILSRYLGEAGHSVLVLEAGPAVGRTWAEYEANVTQYRGAGFKVPNAPYYSPPEVPSPNVLDIRPLTPGSLPDDTGYFVQDGPQPFGTDYLRSQGGTMLHWLGTCLRMCPNDFEMESRYRQGKDWPLSYDELNPYYGLAERELGVSADVEDQGYLGITFPEGYGFPMQRIPLSYLDQRVAETIDDTQVQIDGDELTIKLSSTPQARNSTPNPDYDGGQGYDPVGAYGNPHQGLRCEGNSSCIPICPVQAKYNPLKTWGLVKGNVTVKTQCVVSKVIHSGPGPVSALEYIPYSEADVTPEKPERVTAQVYILAGNAIENAKLLLGSSVPNTNDHIGRHLMDHPYVLAWALMPYNVGAFRGPSSTSGIEVLRDGAFRCQAGGLPDGDRQLGLGLCRLRPLFRRPGRGRPGAVRGDAAAAAGRHRPAPVPPGLPLRAAARSQQPRLRVRRLQGPARDPAPTHPIQRRRLHPGRDAGLAPALEPAVRQARRHRPHQLLAV